MIIHNTIIIIAVNLEKVIAFTASINLFLNHPIIDATLTGIDNLTLFANICSNVNGNDIITNNDLRTL